MPEQPKTLGFSAVKIRRFIITREILTRHHSVEFFENTGGASPATHVLYQRSVVLGPWSTNPLFQAPRSRHADSR